MKRYLTVLAICSGFMSSAIAAEPPQNAAPAAKAEAQPRVISGRTQLEELLTAPAKLDFAGRKQVTVREVLDGLHQQHQLSVRFDIPILAAMLGRSTQSTGYHPAQVALRYSSAPNGHAAYYLDGTPAMKAPAVTTSPVGTASPSVSLPPIAQADPSEVADVLPLVEPAVEPETDKPTPAEAPSADDIHQMLDELLEQELDIQTLDLSRVSIATVLRQALDAALTSRGDESTGMPILMTNAALMDYLVEDDGLLITTRMKALSTRETRVYSIKHLKDLPAEQLSKTIRQSIRPWSWRSQINDLGEQLKGTPLPAETLTSLAKTGLQLVGAEYGVNVAPTADAESPVPQPVNRIDEAKQMEMLGGALTNSLITLAQSTLLALEMVHYAEPPTATIQTLGHKLIITQSQTAHREIAELLKQLADD